MAGFGLTTEESEQYATVKARFDSHFVIRQNTIFERAKFNRRCQEEGELDESFIAALFCMAEFCEYGALNDEMIRDRIVVGIRDSGLSLKLHMDAANLTLKKAIDMVRQNEAAKREQSLMRNFIAEGACRFREDDENVQAETEGYSETSRSRGIHDPQMCFLWEVGPLKNVLQV